MTKDQREAIEAAFAARDTVAMTLRLPRDLRDALAAIAASDRRSLNATIVLACAAALDDRARRAPGGRWRPAWPRASGIGGQPNGSDPDVDRAPAGSDGPALLAALLPRIGR